MIGTTGATVLAIVNVLIAGILGIVVGAISCAVLRRRWTVRAAGIDAVLAMIVFFIAVMAISEIQIRLAHWADALTPGWILAAVAVIAGHLVRRH